jgi:PleD family two-component response regulator
MVDVDHFKKCNDTYGHDSGDQVLRMIATQLNRVGGGGRAFRYGGEEFAILFPDRDVDACLGPLENLRAAIEKLTFTVRAADRPRKKPKAPKKRVKTETISVTVSMGVAGRTSSATPPDEVITAADDVLYRAKKAGRNRIMVATGRAQKAQASA